MKICVAAIETTVFVYNNIRHCGLLDLDYAGAFDGGVNNATDILL
jgi:hypothetical protein